MSWWRIRIIAIVLVALVSSVRVAGGTIVPIDQSRFTLAYVTTDCEGVTEEEEEAKDFGPFDSFVQTVQICDDLGIVASAEADQHSVIGASSMTADGRAFAAGESPSGLHAYSASYFELTFDLPLSSSFTAQGELGVAWGFPGGHDAFFSLTGPGNQKAASEVTEKNQIMRSPPLMSREAPVIYAALSEARNATSSATSSGVPRRLMGKPFAYALTRSSEIVVLTISVSMRPGQTAFTVIPWVAASLAMCRVKPSMPAFAAV